MSFPGKSLIKILRVGNPFTYAVQRAKFSNLFLAKCQGLVQQTFPLKEFRCNYSTRLYDNIYEVPLVDIPREGEFYFMLLWTYNHGESGLGRYILRGRNSAGHKEIYRLALSEVRAKNLCLLPKGGGKIKINLAKKCITISGKCKDYGKADRDDVKEIMKQKYRGFLIKK